MEGLSALVRRASLTASSRPEVVAVVTGHTYRLPQFSTMQTVRALAPAMIQGSLLFDRENSTPGQTSFVKGIPQKANPALASGIPTINRWPRASTTFQQDRKISMSSKRRAVSPWPRAPSKRNKSSTPRLGELTPELYADLAQKYQAGDTSTQTALHVVQYAYLFLDSISHPLYLIDTKDSLHGVYDSTCLKLSTNGISCNTFEDVYRKRQAVCQEIISKQTKEAIQAYYDTVSTWDLENKNVDHMDLDECPEAFREHAAMFRDITQIKRGYDKKSKQPRLVVSALDFTQLRRSYFSMPDLRQTLANAMIYYVCDQEAILYGNKSSRLWITRTMSKYAQQWVHHTYKQWWTTFESFKAERVKMANSLEFPEDWIHEFMLGWAKRSDHSVSFKGDMLCRPSLQSRVLSDASVLMREKDIAKYTKMFER